MFTPFELDLTAQAEAGGRAGSLSLARPQVPPAPAGPGAGGPVLQARRLLRLGLAPAPDPAGHLGRDALGKRPRVHLRTWRRRTRCPKTWARRNVTSSVRLSQAGPGQSALDTCWTRRAGGRVEATATAAADAVTSERGPRPARTLVAQRRGRARPCTCRAWNCWARTARSCRREERKVGFRRIRLVMHEGAWDKPSGSPRRAATRRSRWKSTGGGSSAEAPTGSTRRSSPARITADTYRPLLELAQDAHFNLLRVWGGGIVNKESFFDQCDERGLLVWQEFPLACNDYAGHARLSARAGSGIALHHPAPPVPRQPRPLVRRQRAVQCAGPA